MDKRAKKHKRHKSEKHHKRRAPTENFVVAENQFVDSEQADTSIMMEETEEEIVCDGELDVPSVVDEIDVGGIEEDLNSSANSSVQINITPPPKANKAPATSKKPTAKVVGGSPNTPARAPASSTPLNTTAVGAAASTSKKSKRRRESGTSSDEERWLTAIESGKLDDVDDELKKIKDPRLMTARQRAMYERNLDREPSLGGELLMSLPTGYREKEKPQTAEDIQKAALKSQKRKQQADEKREKDKKKTMERLLKKQESKQRATARSKASKIIQPMITYKNTQEGAYIQMPADCEFPLKAQGAREPPKVQLCGIVGCGQPKVYNCSKTNLPLCSFACYRKNVQAVRQIMC